MRALTALVIALALTGAAAAQAAEPQTTLPDVEDEVMCVECGTALNISQAPSADRQREFIRRRIAEGLTKEQIKAALVVEYGRNVLGTPPATGSGADTASWLVPLLLALLGVAAIVTTVRRWRRVPELERADAVDLDPDDEERLDQDMAAYD